MRLVFQAKDIATILEYGDTDKAIRNYVCAEDKQRMQDLIGSAKKGVWPIMNWILYVLMKQVFINLCLGVRKRS